MAPLTQLSSIFRIAPMFRVCRVIFVRVATALMAVSAVCAAPGDVQEHAIKAAGLFKIISFVEWPPEAFSSPSAPLVIGVLGRGPIVDLLPAFAEDETWNGRRVVLRGLSSPAAGADCHVVYIGRSEQPSWTFIRTHFARRPILTVSDAEQFARTGGVVQLATARNRLHLVINLGSARDAGITISSKVLRLAEVIGDSRP